MGGGHQSAMAERGGKRTNFNKKELPFSTGAELDAIFSCALLELPTMQRVQKQLFEALDAVKSTDLSYPYRASIIGFLGAALTVNAETTNPSGEHFDMELRAHLGDALKLLGFKAVRTQKRSDRPSRPGERKRGRPRSQSSASAV
jgi:hypothetical protein